MYILLQQIITASNLNDLIPGLLAIFMFNLDMIKYISALGLARYLQQ